MASVDALWRAFAADRARGDTTTVRDWTIAQGIVVEVPPLAEVAERALAGESWRFAVREWLDRWYFSDDAVRRLAALQPRPALVDPACDAYLGALAEHLALSLGLPRPDWCLDADRFLATIWFASELPGLRASMIVESPSAFRRRGLFIGATTLSRV